MRAEVIGRALGGWRVGRGWSACCPAHDDRAPSLSISETLDGKVLVRCHAGCDQERVIAALRSRSLWSSATRRADYPPQRQQQPMPAEASDGRRRQALTLWDEATNVSGSVVERYLASRGLTLPPLYRVRFHGSLRHPAGSVFSAMVALVTRGTDDVPIGVHRTFLIADGSGKALVVPSKMMLGPCRGGAVRLSQAADTLLVGEGIETTLAAMRATGLPGWAALSTSGLRALDLPRTITTIVMLADGDAPGEAAAREAALRWSREGRRVRIARPPQGLDFNDMLLGKTPSLQGGTP